MLERVLVKGNVLPLMVGMQIDIACMVDGMKIPENLGIKPPHDTATLLLGLYPEENKIEKDTFVSVLMRWMYLEPIINSEVSQNEKDKYSILTYI